MPEVHAVLGNESAGQLFADLGCIATANTIYADASSRRQVKALASCALHLLVGESANRILQDLGQRSNKLKTA